MNQLKVFVSFSEAHLSSLQQRNYFISKNKDLLLTSKILEI
jgi:hypothetical protein